MDALKGASGRAPPTSWMDDVRVRAGSLATSLAAWLRSDSTRTRTLQAVIGVEAAIVLLHAVPNTFLAKEVVIRWIARSSFVRRASQLMPWAGVFLLHVLVRELDGAGDGVGAAAGAGSSTSSGAVAAKIAAAVARAQRSTAAVNQASFGLLLLLFVHRTYYLTRNNAKALINLEHSAMERDMLEFTPSRGMPLLQATYAAAFRPMLLGLENIPTDRPLLFVGNHPVLALDAPVLVAELYKQRGIYLRMLADHSHFQIPVNAHVLQNVVGAVDGTRSNCELLFQVIVLGPPIPPCR